jgi:PAS domain-containing protein
MSRSLEPSSASSQRFAGRSSLAASAIVGLGVAADNIASASEFFRHLPPDTGMAFVVVAHQPSPSAAVAALARGTPMKVTDVRQRTRPRPNHVYVTSPDGVLEIEGDDPWLVRRRPVSDPSRIDAFFRSLAQQRRYGAIGVLLAGTGAVGHRGLGAIREQGGLTYAEEAPVADFVFRPAAIAREIAWLGRDRSFGAGLRRVGAAHLPGVRHILRLPTDDRDVLRAEQQSLATVNEELEHLLDSLDVPMVVVDGERCVRRFTSSARRMVNVIASDIGRPIGDIHWNVSVNDVDEMVRSAAASGTTAQRDVQDRNGRYNVLTVRPYRAAGGRPAGAVITLVDIDAHAAARTALQSELELQDAVTQELVGVSQVPDGAMHLVRTICQRTAWPYGELWTITSGAGTHLERMAFWSELASGRPKTLAAASVSAGGRAIAERVLSSGEGVVWHLRDALGNDPGVSDKRLLVFESEFSSALRAMGRDGNTLSAQLRQAWDSGALQILTKNSPVQATNSHLSLISHITKPELLRYLNSTECANGFGNRFLWCCVKRSQLLPEGGNLQQDALRDVVEQVRTALTFATTAQEILRDAEARKMWCATYPELTADHPGLLGRILARAEAQTMRVALIYALLDCSPLIQRQHLEAALAVLDFVTASAEWIFGELYGEADADRILKALRESADGLTRTEVSALFRHHKSQAQIESALLTLESAQLAYREIQSTGGRSVERWFAKEKKAK